MRIIALFVITFMLIVNFASAEDFSTEVAKKARNATVLVSNNRGENYGGFGSGVVISPTGLVLTNYHVIHRADTLRVFFYDPTDNNYYKAEVIGIDPVADLALLQLKVDKKMLPLEFLLIEDEEWNVADDVMAIGHPMGIQWTVSLGHISHTDRTGRVTPYVATLQHSAEIHRGNSGGPLINSEGDVVGINTYLLMPDRKWSGIAYAVRGDIVQWSANQMIEDARVQAQVEGERIRQQAREAIDQEINKAREGLRAQVAELAVLGAEKILQEKVNPETHANMLNQLAAKL